MKKLRPLLAPLSLLDTCACVGASLASNAAAARSSIGATVLLPVHLSAGLLRLEAERISMLQYLLHAILASGPCSTVPIMAALLAAGVIHHTAYDAMLSSSSRL